MVTIATDQSPVTPEFVSRLADRAAEAERARRLPAATLAEATESGLFDLLVPARYGGREAPFSAILDPVRQMAHGCASSAWTLGFYALHNWMLALFSEAAQSEGFATRPFLAPAPLAPTGRGIVCDGGIRLTGRWSWATGVMDGNWIMVGALCERSAGDPSSIVPVLALLPIDDARIEEVLRSLSLWEKRKAKIAELSGGMKRRAKARHCASLTAATKTRPSVVSKMS